MSTMTKTKSNATNVTAPFYDPVTGDVDLAVLRGLPYDYPLGIPEIAVALGVKRQTVDVWRWRTEFPPEESSTIGGRPWWRWGVVCAWAVKSHPPRLVLDMASAEGEPTSIHTTRRRRHLTPAAAMEEV